MKIQNDLQKFNSYLDFIILQWNANKTSVKTYFEYIIDCLQKDYCISKKTSNR